MINKHLLKKKSMLIFEMESLVADRERAILSRMTLKLGLSSIYLPGVA